MNERNITVRLGATEFVVPVPQGHRLEVKGMVVEEGNLVRFGCMRVREITRWVRLIDKVRSFRRRIQDVLTRLRFRVPEGA